MTEIEEWRPYEDWPYEVSNLGNVRRTGSAMGATPGYLMKIITKANGYLVVKLTHLPRRRLVLVSRMVCTAFHGPPPKPDWHADHMDRTPLNCREDNLQWLSPGNNLSRTRHRRGVDHHLAKITNRDVLAIRAAPAKYVRQMINASGLCPQTFFDIRKGKTWTHVRQNHPSLLGEPRP